MSYVYHGVPNGMKGRTLIPLNQMRATNLELHNEYVKKYAGREEILGRKIPLLNCLWNDVVQLLPLHPKKVFQCQQDIGLISELPNYEYFEIDVTSLDPGKTVVYFKTAPGEENVTVKWLTDVNLDELQELPEATKQYYESCVGKSEPVFNYQFVPHIISMGNIDVSESKVISISK